MHTLDTYISLFEAHILYCSVEASWNSHNPSFSSQYIVSTNEYNYILSNQTPCMAPANPFPYEYTLRQPGIELTVRTSTVRDLTRTHLRATQIIEATHSYDDEPFIRYNVPHFLTRDQRFLKRLARYERKYPDLKVIDFSIPLTPNVRLDTSRAGVTCSLSDEQIGKARTRVAASMPEHTSELWIITLGNLSESEANRLAEPLGLRDRIRLEHRETDLDDILRIVVFCFTPTEAVPFE